MPEPRDFFLFRPPDANGILNGGGVKDVWLEQVDLYGPSTLAIGKHRSYTTLRGYIPWRLIPEVIPYFLGFSYLNASTFLNRINPPPHPYIDGLTSFELPDGVPLAFILKDVSKALNNQLPFARYDQMLITAAYQQCQWNIVKDGNCWNQNRANAPGLQKDQPNAGELCRNVTVSPSPFVDPLEVPGGQLTWDAPNVTGIDGYPAGQGLRIFFMQQMTRYKLIWYDVPLDFVANDSGKMPHIDNCIGKINDRPFFMKWPQFDGRDNFPRMGDGFGGELGMATHTLRLDKVYPVNEEVYQDVSANLGNAARLHGNINAAGTQRRVDLVFEFTHFDPPNGYKVLFPDTPQGKERGWRLLPHSTGNYLNVKTTGSSGLPGFVFPLAANFDEMFIIWSESISITAAQAQAVADRP